MAAVYSAQDGSVQIRVETISPENSTEAVNECSAGSASSDQVLRENVEVGPVLSRGDPAVKAEEHAGAAASSPAVSAIVIKEEPMEENEYVTVHVDSSGEETDRSSDYTCKDESTNGDWLFLEDSSEASGKKDAYVEHRHDHAHDGPIVCLDADSQCDNLLVSTGGDHRMLCCALCGREFSSSRGFFNHQLKHRNQLIKQESVVETKQKIFECKDCGKTYASIGQCLNHQRSHKQASKSVFHQLAHLKKKSFQCPTCGRCYSRASALDAHRRCHEVKLFKSKSSEVEKHQPDNDVTVKSEEEATVISEQTEEPPKKLFECYCGKSFRTMSGLGTHQRFSANCSNTQVKVKAKPSFDCTECGKSFDSALAVACHQRWHKRRAHNSQEFKCTECGKCFTSLTFLSKHQRFVHSNELAAKSFLNQVCQLQKKTFECPDCGCRFSRASALHSHQLCHTDIFGDILEGSSKTASTAHEVKSYQCDRDEPGSFGVGGKTYSQDAWQPKVIKKKIPIGGTKNHGAVAADLAGADVFRSDPASQNDEKQDLELVCESDQEDIDLSIDVTCQPVNPDVNINIIQVDYPHFKEDSLNMEVDRSPAQEAKKYECPDCHRTFNNALSLRCHMLWHRDKGGKKSRYGRKNRILNPVRKVTLRCEICGHESFTKTDYYFHLRKHEDRKPYKSISYQLEGLRKNSFECEVCGMQFSRASALSSHMQHHKKKLYECSQCDKSYSNLGSLQSHQKHCSGKELCSRGDEGRKDFNPSKTLLGPKVHHCKKCGKGFWSMGAYYHHRQYHPQCADVKLNMSTPSEDGHPKHKGRGRKKSKTGKRRGHYNIQSRTLYKCEVCDKSYRVIACFLKHQLTHSNAPPVKSFDHQLKQLKNNSYSCPDCGKLFSRAMALQFHMKSHGYDTGLSAEKQLSGASGGPQCGTCLSVFTCESALQVHQKHCTKPPTTEGLEVSLKTDAENLNASRESDDQMQTDEAENDVGSENRHSMHPSDLKYKCSVCGKSFSVLVALNFHKRIHRQDPTSKETESEFADVPSPESTEQSEGPHFCCSECGRTFSTNSALGTHRRWHKDKKLARFLLKNSKIFRKSMDSGPFLCNLCGKGFFYLCVLRRHQKYHPPLGTQSNAELAPKAAELDTTCLKRKRDQSDVGEPDNLESEVSVSPATAETETACRNNRKVKCHCAQCNKNFSNSRGLRAHKWQKHKRRRGRPAGGTSGEVKPFPCSGCDRSYGSLASLQNHRRVCSSMDLKPLDKKQTAEGPASSHQLIESPAKCLFKCQKCGKVFSSEHHLEAHKEAARTRPYSCTLCCRGYWTEPQLRQHLIWHDEVRSRLPNELRYRLNSSGASTKVQVSGANQPSLAANLHESPQPFSCSVCPKTFAKISDLIDHQQECLGAKQVIDTALPASSPDTESLTCIECGVSFSQESDLHQHYIDHARGEL